MIADSMPWNCQGLLPVRRDGGDLEVLTRRGYEVRWTLRLRRRGGEEACAINGRVWHMRRTNGRRQGGQGWGHLGGGRPQLTCSLGASRGSQSAARSRVTAAIGPHAV